MKGHMVLLDTCAAHRFNLLRLIASVAASQAPHSDDELYSVSGTGSPQNRGLQVFYEHLDMMHLVRAASARVDQALLAEDNEVRHDARHDMHTQNVYAHSQDVPDDALSTDEKRRQRAALARKIRATRQANREAAKTQGLSLADFKQRQRFEKRKGRATRSETATKKRKHSGGAPLYADLRFAPADGLLPRDNIFLPEKVPQSPNFVYHERTHYRPINALTRWLLAQPWVEDGPGWLRDISNTPCPFVAGGGPLTLQHIMELLADVAVHECADFNQLPQNAAFIRAFYALIPEQTSIHQRTGYQYGRTILRKAPSRHAWTDFRVWYSRKLRETGLITRLSAYPKATAMIPGFEQMRHFVDGRTPVSPRVYVDRMNTLLATHYPMLAEAAPLISTDVPSPLITIEEGTAPLRAAILKCFNADSLLRLPKSIFLSDADYCDATPVGKLFYAMLLEATTRWSYPTTRYHGHPTIPFPDDYMLLPVAKSAPVSFLDALDSYCAYVRQIREPDPEETVVPFPSDRNTLADVPTYNAHISRGENLFFREVDTLRPLFRFMKTMSAKTDGFVHYFHQSISHETRAEKLAAREKRKTARRAAKRVAGRAAAQTGETA